MSTARNATAGRGRKTTYRSNASLSTALARVMREQKVSPRRKSTWIGEALAQLMVADPALGSVGVGEDRPGVANRRLETITLSDAAAELVDRAYAIIRRDDPRAEGLFSEIIRAAIRHGVDAHERESRTRKA